MSEATICNYCSLQAIKRRGTKVRLVKDPLKDEQGEVVWPGGVRVVDKKDGETIVWFGSLPDRCVC